MTRDPVQTATVSPDVKVAISRVPREDGSNIIVYRFGDGKYRSSLPSIVLLHGSGANSVFPQSGNHTSVPLLFDALYDVRNQWNVYFVEKRGICFGQCEPEGGVENANIDYQRGASYSGRVTDVCGILDKLFPNPTNPKRPLVLIGSSEGSDIAVGIAAKHSGPTHIALLPFSGGHGLYDSLTKLRGELAQGAITANEFLEQYDWLVNMFQDVLGTSMDAIDKHLWGHTYRRWSSHCSGTVMADLLSVDIPVFLGIPSLDSCEGIDMVVDQFVKHGKENLTYRNYVDYDHGFFEHIGERAECRHSRVLTDILKWVQAKKKAEQDR